jgi:hypothetical protein
LFSAPTVFFDVPSILSRELAWYVFLVCGGAQFNILIFQREPTLMRRSNLLLHILLVLTLAMASLPGRAQTGRTGAVYSRPVKVDLQRTTRRAFRDPNGFDVEGFYPIGWSKDGNFAYYAEPVDEACGCYFAKLFIYDLRNDKLLWKFEYEGDTIEDDRREGKPYSLNTLWRANHKLFSGKLREYGIEPRVDSSLLTFPATYAGDRLTADFKTKEKEGRSDDQRLYGNVGKLMLQLNSQRNGRKTVLDYSYTGEDGLPLYVGLLGYVKSPFEPRIAVIMVEIYRGYEGPPNTGTVKIAGAHLATGFK